MMLQYQRQGQLDVAVQVAMQILRSTSACAREMPSTLRATGAVDANRSAAINMLARSGRLAAAHRARHGAAQEDSQVDRAAPDAG